MTQTDAKILTLTLEDGTVLQGKSFGAHTKAAGEVVFNTGMVGYPETLSDPSYKGQILVITYPLVGNYGVPGTEQDKHKIEQFFESRGMQISGLIVTEYSDNHNHWQATQSLGEWLKKSKVPGITGIDTRALTQKIREKGSLLGTITIDPKEKLAFYDPNKENLIAQVSIKAPEHYKAGRKHIALVDCGMKHNILRDFLKRDVSVTRVPWNHDVWNMNTKFDGIFFSNGPGDPAMMKETVKIMKGGFERKVPTFGICMGSQLMGLAAGGTTYKMKFGHRSQNQPCTNLETGQCSITSQNHGYAIDLKSLPKDWKVWFENANDKTIEGIKHRKLPFSSVQFHPEATPGPTDTSYLFDDFVASL